jgi:hypothetical protein
MSTYIPAGLYNAEFRQEGDWGRIHPPTITSANLPGGDGGGQQGWTFAEANREVGPGQVEVPGPTAGESSGTLQQSPNRVQDLGQWSRLVMLQWARARVARDVLSLGFSYSDAIKKQVTKLWTSLRATLPTSTACMGTRRTG